MQTITVTQNGRVIIPAAIRKKLNIKKGEKLFVTGDEDGIFISRTYAAQISRMRGCLKSKGGSASKLLLRERKRDTAIMEKQYRRLFP